MNPSVPSALRQVESPNTAAPFLPMSRAEMDALGWYECDIVLVTGDEVAALAGLTSLWRREAKTIRDSLGP
jgi:hypothetical protein